MALSILSYNLPQGLKMSANINSNNNNNSNNHNNGSNSRASPPTVDENSSQSGRTTISIGKSFSRITMQNVLTESSSNVLNISNNSNVNTIVRKIKDIGMYGSVNNAGALSATISGRKRSNSETRAPTPNTNATEKKAEEAKLSIKRAKKKDENAREKSQKLTSNKSVPNKSAATIPTSNRPKVSNTPGTKKPAGTPGRKGLPLPQAVARRNARERNRVKQVNNGFAALRQRIPEEVAEAFEAQGNGRGTVKKLSKVETLRMAVEYIRSLEHLLGFDFTPGSDRGITLLQASSSSDDSFTFIKDEFDALSSPPLDDTNFDDSLSNYDVDEYLNSTSDFCTQSMISQPAVDTTDASAYEMDLLPSLTTINGLQYVRIAGTNAYQLLTPDMLFMHANAAPHSPPTSSLDEESFQTLIDTNCLSPITTTSPPTHISPASEISVINSNAAPAVTTLQHQQQQQNSDRAPSANGEIVDECVNILSARSSVQSTPTVHTSLHQKQQQQQQHQQPTTQQRAHQRQPQTPTQGSSPLSSSSNLSPADNDTILLPKCAPTCATNVDDHDNDDHDEIDGYVEHNTRQHFVALPTPITLSRMQPSHATIKQEFNDTLRDDFALDNAAVRVPANVTPSPTDNLSTSAMLVFQQQLQERLLFSQTALSQTATATTTTTTMSPPTRATPTPTTTANNAPATPTILFVPQSVATTPTTPGLSSFYDGEHDNSYFEGSHLILKKEYNDALLQATAAAQTATEQNAFSGLPDENIIEVMDWWDAHTPKSDGSVALM